MELLTCVLKGDYALFKKPFANNQQQSFLVPTKTAIAGMLSAILGYDKDNYIKRIEFNNLKIGIQVISEIKKDLFGINLMHGESSFNFKQNPLRSGTGRGGGRAPTRLEVLKNVRYKVYIYHKNKKIFDSLGNYILNNKCEYVPYLGQQNMFVSLLASKIVKAEAINISKLKNELQVFSIIPKDFIKNYSLSTDFILIENSIPYKMESDRSKPQTIKEFIFTIGLNSAICVNQFVESDRYLLVNLISNKAVVLF